MRQPPKPCTRTNAIGWNWRERSSSAPPPSSPKALASSFELTSEQSNFLQEQQAYIQRVADLVNARTELRKTLDLF